MLWQARAKLMNNNQTIWKYALKECFTELQSMIRLLYRRSSKKLHRFAKAQRATVIITFSSGSKEEAISN
jgi:hypothetical protein